MSAYVVVDIEIHDAADYETYRSQTLPTIIAHGGQFLARGGAVHVLEGDWHPKRLVIIEFPSAEQARAWWESPEYSAIKGIRQRSSRTNLLIVEGFVPA